MGSKPDSSKIGSTTQAWTKTIYPFNRENIDTELDRLNYNHFNVWLPLTGQLVPTHILDSVKQPPIPRVADVATGNGTWLFSIAEHLPPQTELYGFDLDPLKFPSAKGLEPNIVFQQQNVLSLFPAGLQGTFDLVHVRLLFFGMKAADWDVAVQHLAALLKPGGWMLWEELGQMSVRAFPPSSAFDEWWRTHMLHGVKNGRDPMMPYRLLNKFKGADLENCDDKVWFTWSSESLTETSAPAVLIRSVKPMLTAVVENGGFNTIQTMEDVTRVEETIEREVQEGTRIGFDWHWVWGMKPLHSQKSNV